MLQTFMIVGTISFFCFVIKLVKEEAISLKYSLVWIFSIGSMIIISIFPQILYSISNSLNFELPSNALFVLLFILIIAIILSTTSVISKQSIMIRNIVQENSLLEKRLRDLEEIKKN